MCIPGAETLLTVMAGGGGAAAGATATATTLQTIGTYLAIGGAVYQGVAGYQAGKAQASAIEDQKKTEAELTAVKEHRTRQKFNSEIRRQFAEIAGRGVSLDSPTAVLLGQEAAKELSFEAQSVRAGGQATQVELSSQQRIARSDATMSLISGGFSAAGALVKHGDDTWPGLLS